MFFICENELEDGVEIIGVACDGSSGRDRVVNCGCWRGSVDDTAFIGTDDGLELDKLIG